MNLFKGIFWVADGNSEDFIFRIPCDTDGNITGKTEYPLNSKDGTNYNHKALWASLPKPLTCGKLFNYFPRGRVEIRNARATVYLNTDINYREIQDYIINNFGLVKCNGVMSVRFVSDGSNHYKYKGENL